MKDHEKDYLIYSKSLEKNIDSSLSKIYYKESLEIYNFCTKSNPKNSLEEKYSDLQLSKIINYK